MEINDESFTTKNWGKNKKKISLANLSKFKHSDRTKSKSLLSIPITTPEGRAVLYHTNYSNIIKRTWTFGDEKTAAVSSCSAVQ
jgi:hypothetical protein